MQYLVLSMRYVRKCQPSEKLKFLGCLGVNEPTQSSILRKISSFFLTSVSKHNYLIFRTDYFFVFFGRAKHEAGVERKTRATGEGDFHLYQMEHRKKSEFQMGFGRPSVI